MLKTLLCTILLIFSFYADATIRYVKPGASGTGIDWTNASGDVQAMINASSSGDEVWVAGGTYQRPVSGQPFVMKEGVKLYGGFAGTETALSQRDLSVTANKSTLQGNGASVVYNSGNALTNAAVLDGFTITGGQTTYGGGMFNLTSSPTIANCTISGNNATQMGGGIFSKTATPFIINCTISSNTAPYGGGICNDDANAIITNCTISGNTMPTIGLGGGIHNRNTADPIITNCTISGNKSTQGGGVYNASSSPKLTNCTISGNQATDGGGMYNASSSPPRLRNCILYGNNSGIVNIAGSTPDIQWCLVQGLTGTTTGNQSGAIDPLFVSPLAPGLSTGGDYRLQPCSPVLDKGNNNYFASGQSIDLSAITTDLAGNPRIYNSVKVDMGAYERQGVTVAVNASGMVYVKAGGTGTGESWACATGDLQAAINAAASGNKVWVALGSYQRGSGQSFNMKEGVKIYGGFAGTETTLSQRDLSVTANKSTLQGNGASVVNNANLSPIAVLDGFTITGGNAAFGGGIYNDVSASPTIANCTISGNTAATYGGGLYNYDFSFPNLVNCIISGNTAGTYGGGLYNSASPPNLTNCTISGNRAGSRGGGMYNTGGSTPRLRNCIVYGNSSGIWSIGGAPDILYSLVQDITNTPGGTVTDATDPLFVSPVAYTSAPTTGGDYRLQTCSPAINAGNNSIYNSGQSPDLSAFTTDPVGITRLLGTAVDMGAYEFTGSNGGNPGGAELLAINGDAASVMVAGSTTLTATLSACRTMVTVVPDGTGTSISGSVQAKVWVESTQPVAYVKRHYEITPAVNATTATGRVTLYFTQEEFDDFNAVNTLQLPTGAGDATHIANLRIEKRSGISSDGSGLPATYTGTFTTIDPADADIVWNSAASRWELSFDVTGFSGFFVKTQTFILPLHLLSFKGTKQNDYNQLQWTTAEEVNTQHFELESSTDGRTFARIATINAVGNGNSSYSYNDRAAYNGKIFYRLKMVDIDERFTYSQIIWLTHDGKNSVSLYPNPASDVVHINTGSTLLHSKATLHDVNGRLLQTITITTSPQTIHVQQLASGCIICNLRMEV